MLCKDAMKTAVKTCQKNASVAECAKLMAEHGIGFVPVVDGHGKLLGVVTDRDLAVRVLAESRAAQTSVEDVMTTNVVTCAPDDGLRFAEKCLAENRKSRIVVLDAFKNVVGVLSLSDIGQLEDPTRAGLVFKTIAHREATGVAGARK